MSAERLDDASLRPRSWCPCETLWRKISVKSVGDKRVEQIWAFQWHHQCGLSAERLFEMRNAGYSVIPDWMDQIGRASCLHPTFKRVVKTKIHSWPLWLCFTQFCPHCAAAPILKRRRTCNHFLFGTRPLSVFPTPIDKERFIRTVSTCSPFFSVFFRRCDHVEIRFIAVQTCFFLSCEYS